VLLYFFIVNLLLEFVIIYSLKPLLSL